MLDYRNNLKRILQNTDGDDQSLQNSLNAIKAIIAMVDTGQDQPKVKTKTKSIPQRNADDKQIKQLLSSLAKLITIPGDENAKKTALSALHKLTFEPGVGKKFGTELGQLDQAIQRSTTTKEAVNAQIFQEAVKPKEPPKRDYRKGKRYTVIRLVSGADLVNNQGQTVFTVKESQVRPLNLKTGDIVEAIEERSNPNYEAEILRVVGYEKLRKRDYDQIEEFRYAVVQGNSNNLSISRNIRGEKLKIRGKEVVVSVDSSYYQGDGISLTDGSIVDLDWYSGDVRLKKNPADAVQIRWIYDVDQPETSSSKKKKSKDQNQEVQELPELDMDLHYQRVGIAIGDNQNEKILESIVSRYNGIPIPIDAFEGKKKVLENQIKDLDIVILVTAFAAHDSTWGIREYASKYHVKFAVSSSKGYQAFERALYRADQGLPAYEGTQSIEYRQKSK